MYDRGGNPVGFEADHYFWERLTAPASGSYSTQLHNIASIDDSFELRVMLRGRTDDPIDPDHHTRVYLNETLVSDELWEGQIEYLHQVAAAQSLLL